MEWEAVKNQFRHTWLTTLLSCVLFAGVTYFLLWSEYNTIENTVTLDELLSAAEHIDVHKFDESEKYEGKVVHIIGPLRVQEPITEPDYNLQVLCVKLRKRVQMYQWIEETRDTEHFLTEPGDESQKQYLYHKDWRDYVVDSQQFYLRGDHQNPTIIPLQSVTHLAENVKIGWLSLGTELKRQVHDYHEVWSDARPARADVRLHSGFYYHGASALQHAVGDLRVHFTYAGREDDVYTAVGVVRGGRLEPREATGAGGAAGAGRWGAAGAGRWGAAGVLRRGALGPAALARAVRAERGRRSWQCRALGLLQVFASAMTLHPDWAVLLVQSKWASSKLRECSRTWVSFVVAWCYTAFVIALPWLQYAPGFSALALCCAAAPALYYSALLRRAPRPHQR